MLHILQVGGLKQACCNLQIINTVLEIGCDDLFPSSCQFVKIQQAYGTYGVLSIFLGDPSHQHRTEYQYTCHDDAAYQSRFFDCTLSPAFVIISHPCFTLLYYHRLKTFCYVPEYFYVCFRLSEVT